MRHNIHAPRAVGSTRRRNTSANGAIPSSNLHLSAPDPALVWISGLKHRTRHRGAVETLSMFYFGRQRPSVTARLVGLTPAALATFYSRIGLPRYADRSQLRDSFDASLARQVLERSGYTLATCRCTGNLFWSRHDFLAQFQDAEGVSTATPS